MPEQVGEHRQKKESPLFPSYINTIGCVAAFELFQENGIIEGGQRGKVISLPLEPGLASRLGGSWWRRHSEPSGWYHCYYPGRRTDLFWNWCHSGGRALPAQRGAHTTPALTGVSLVCCGSEYVELYDSIMNRVSESSSVRATDGDFRGGGNFRPSRMTHTHTHRRTKVNRRRPESFWDAMTRRTLMQALLLLALGTVLTRAGQEGSRRPSIVLFLQVSHPLRWSHSGVYQSQRSRGHRSLDSGPVDYFPEVEQNSSSSSRHQNSG